MQPIGGYEIVRELGRGGAGVVFAARDPGLDREVALKLLVRGQEESVSVQRLQRESEALGKLRHPNVVGIHAVGEHEGAPFVVMDLVPGIPLSERLAKVGPLPVREAVRIVLGVAEGLAHAHERGVLHRDVKPANVLLHERGHPVLTDFGLARDVAPGRHSLTQAGAALGTPAYWPPEQAKGDREAVGERSDVYSLGATLYELLTGETPFARVHSLVKLMLATANERPVPPSAHRPQVDPALDALCLRCLEKEPERRYPSARALADDLERYLAGPTPGRGTGRRLTLALVAVGLVLAVAAGVTLWSPPGADRSGELAAEPQSTVPRVEPSPPAVDPERMRRARALLDAAKLETSPAEARRLVDEALKLTPEFGGVWFLRGRLLVELEDEAVAEDAAAALKQADTVEVPFTDPELYLLRGRLLSSLKRWEEARPDLALAVEQQPYDAELAFSYAYTCRMTGYHEDAVRVFRSILAREGQAAFWTVPFNMAGSLDDLGRPREAIAAYRQALDLSRGRQRYHPLWRLAGELVEVEQFREAEALLEQALELDGRQSSALRTMSLAKLKQGQFDAAVRYAERAVLGTPSDGWAIHFLADALVAKGRPGDARQAILAYLRNPQHSVARPELSQLLEQLGN